jgi:hypothetical protein
VSFESRWVWEAGDPIADHLAREERSDHHRARARGQRLLLLADSLVDELQAHSMLRNDGVIERRLIFHILAQALYSNGAVDIPDFTNEQSLEALRRGRALHDDGGHTDGE